MKKIQRISGIVVIIQLFLVMPGIFNVARAQKKYIQPNQKYKAGKMYLKSNKYVKVNNIILINDSTLKYTTPTGSSNYISTEEVHWVSVKTGSQAASGALTGGGIGLLTVLTVHLEHEADPYHQDIDFGPLYLGFGAGGLLIGALIGSASASWESLYMPSVNKSGNLKLNTSFRHGYPALQLVYRL